MNSDSSESLQILLDACIRGDRSSQKTLYQRFYGYAMSICLRYAPDKEQAQEILNDGFLKVFLKLNTFEPHKSFQYWLRRILINTAIDYYRRNRQQQQTIDKLAAEPVYAEADALDSISEQEILQLVQKLPPAYRLVFNLHIIEGYKHEEIAAMLGISEGTSKSNLAKARKHLQEKLYKLNQVDK